MRKLLLAAATLVAVPVSAQQAAVPAQNSVQPTRVPAQPAPVPVQNSAQLPAPAPNGITSGSGAITPAPPPAEVAGIVAREFPAYDRDRNGALDQAEFGDWMIKLKTIADPTLRADAPSTRTWLNAAFAQADADRSRTLTLGELTGFLLPGQS